MKKIAKLFLFTMFMVVVCVTIVGCGTAPNVPKNLSIDGMSEPVLKVYDTSSKTIVNTNVESYIEGVVAGEMYPSWPLEALKAQAVLARTYTLHFVKNKGASKYSGADISTDICEAQAYAPQLINDNVKRAVRETRGVVLANSGEFIESWFHANSGGKTSTVKEGFNSKGSSEPEFVKIASSPETAENSQNAVWTAKFTKAEMLNALSRMKISVASVSPLLIAEKGNSGRAITLSVGGKIVDCPALRLSLGSTKFKSTFITDINSDKNGVSISGKGYGHGVGLSQWGA
ncbi:MAG: SpoIID/LytB domain-containing protein, partial [Clostridia bacterium]